MVGVSSDTRGIDRVRREIMIALDDDRVVAAGWRLAPSFYPVGAIAAFAANDMLQLHQLATKERAAALEIYN